MIKVNNLSKSFQFHKKEPGLVASIKSLFHREVQEKFALQDISFEIVPGNICALVGANGAGKTTLIKILSGIVAPSSGEVKVCGHIPFERSIEFRRQIALVMGQKAQLWWDLPAEDCFMLLKEIFQISNQEFKETKDELVELLEVGDHLRTQIRRLSLGERMKMELIAALLHRPSVIFLDEPTIGLDFKTQKSVRQFLKNYAERNKPIILLTSHYLDDIKALARQLMVINQGCLVFNDDISKLPGNGIKSVTFFAPSFNLCGINGGIKLSLSENIIAKAKLEKQDGNEYTVTIEEEYLPELLAYIVAGFTTEDLRINEQDMTLVLEKLMANR